jgi:hypothetical protein
MRRRRYRKSRNRREAAGKNLLSARLLSQPKHYAKLMAVMMPREKWTDERLDDLQGEMRAGFADTKAEMRGGFARVDGEIRELRRKMNERFNAVDARFDAVNRNMLAGFFVIVAAIIGSNAALIASNVL